MKKSIPALLAIAASANAIAAPAKVGNFELKRYSDEKNVSKVLAVDIDGLDDPTCVSQVLDSQTHKALVAFGGYVQAVVLKNTTVDDDPAIGVTLEYGSVRQGQAGVVKKTLQCPLASEETPSKPVTSVEGF